MNLKSIALGAAVAATAIGTTAISPAQAATLNGGFQFISPAAKAVEIDANTIELQLSQSGPFTVSYTTGDFVGVTGAPVFKDLSLNRIFGTLGSGAFSVGNAPLPSFISGLTLGANPVSFDLAGGNFISKFISSTDFSLAGILNGDFVSNGITIGTGSVTLSSISGVGTSGQATSVPTPALLPGLLGLGVAALRKRKGEGTEAENETVEVKA